MDFPAPMKPTRTIIVRSPRVSPARARGSWRARPSDRPTVSPPNFSRTASARVRATTDSHTTPAAGTAQTSVRSWKASAGSPVAMSTVLRRFLSVLRGFIAARSRRSPPMLMPPSVPPARFVRAPEVRLDLVVGLGAAAGSRPRKPSPTSTPLIAGTAMSAPGKPPVELPVPVNVAAEARRQTERDHLDDASEGVALRACLLDGGDHRLRRGFVEAASR